MVDDYFLHRVLPRSEMTFRSNYLRSRTDCLEKEYEILTPVIRRIDKGETVSAAWPSPLRTGKSKKTHHTIIGTEISNLSPSSFACRMGLNILGILTPPQILTLNHIEMTDARIALSVTETQENISILQIRNL